jgi:hypothetical protein
MIRILAVLAVLACVPSLAAAQIKQLDRYQRTVYAQFRGLAQQSSLGDMTHEIYMGELADDATASLSVTLDAGTDYMIVGVCDEDCTDLDLTLFSGSRELDTDVEDDDTPIVSVTPTSTGTFRVSVSMAACSSSPCRFGVAVYEQK